MKMANRTEKLTGWHSIADCDHLDDLIQSAVSMQLWEQAENLCFDLIERTFAKCGLKGQDMAHAYENLCLLLEAQGKDTSNYRMLADIVRKQR